MKNLFTSNTSSQGIVFTPSSGASFYTLAGSSSGNIGIGTINPSSKMTIYSNGSVGMSGTSFSNQIFVGGIFEELRPKFFDIVLNESSRFDGESVAKIYDMLKACGGTTGVVLDIFVRFKDILNEKRISRNTEIALYDLFVKKIYYSWVEPDSLINIFEKIDD
jgi:hypothetical protein